MPDEELTLVLKLRDEATKQMKSARGVITAAGAAIAAAGFTAGKKWDTATKTIVDGTGATGEALAGLQKDYQAVAKYGDGAATVIADLNTHLGLEGEELQRVAAAALKAKVDTNLFGDVASQLGLDAEGAAGFLDQLTVASQGTGVDIDTLTRTIGKSSARWQAAGGDMDDLAATVIAAADEFGPSGLRGAMSEIMQEVDKGLLPTVASLETQLGEHDRRRRADLQGEQDVGATPSQRPRTRLWPTSARRVTCSECSGLRRQGWRLAGPQMLKWIKATKFATIAQKAFNLAMRLNPIGAHHHSDHAGRTRHLHLARSDMVIFEGGLERADQRARERLQLYRPSGPRHGRGEPLQLRCNSSPLWRLRRWRWNILRLRPGPCRPFWIEMAVAAEEAKEEVDWFTGTVDDSSAALGHWGLDISNIGTKMKDELEPFMWDLTKSIDGQSVAVGHWGLELKGVGTVLDAELPPALSRAQQALGKFTD